MIFLFCIIDDDACFILGGDLNCTPDFTVDRNGEEPHNQSRLV